MDAEADKLLAIELEAVVTAERAGDQSEEARHLSKAIGIDASDVRLLIRLGYALIDRHMIAEAKSVFNKALSIDKTAAGAYTGLGHCLVEIGEYGQAECSYRQAVSLSPTPSRWVFLGDVQLEQDNVAEAESSFQSALLLDPTYEEAYLNLGILTRDVDAEQAIEYFKRAIEIDSEYSLAFRELGFVLGRNGRHVDAIKAIHTAINLDPADYWAHIYLATSFELIGKIIDAEIEYQLACKIGRNDAAVDPHLFFARFYFKCGRHKEASLAVQEAIQVASDEVTQHLAIARCQMQIGDDIGSTQSLKKAQEVDTLNRSMKELRRTIQVGRGPREGAKSRVRSGEDLQ